MEGGLYMTFEKRSTLEVSAIPRTGCSGCSGCSGDLGASTSQANFGTYHSNLRQNKGC